MCESVSPPQAHRPDVMQAPGPLPSAPRIHICGKEVRRQDCRDRAPETSGVSPVGKSDACCLAAARTSTPSASAVPRPPVPDCCTLIEVGGHSRNLLHRLGPTCSTRPAKPVIRFLIHGGRARIVTTAIHLLTPGARASMHCGPRPTGQLARGSSRPRPSDSTTEFRRGHQKRPAAGRQHLAHRCSSYVGTTSTVRALRGQNRGYFPCSVGARAESTWEDPISAQHFTAAPCADDLEQKSCCCLGAANVWRSCAAGHVPPVFTRHSPSTRPQAHRLMIFQPHRQNVLTV